MLLAQNWDALDANAADRDETHPTNGKKSRVEPPLGIHGDTPHTDIDLYVYELSLSQDGAGRLIRQVRAGGKLATIETAQHSHPRL